MSIKEVYGKRSGSIIRTTAGAVFVNLDGEDVWIPRSTLSYRSDQELDRLSPGSSIDLEVAEWFLDKKGI